MEKHTFRRCAAVLAACTVMATAASFGTASDSAADGVSKWGDANCDGMVDMSDCVLIMQALANPNKYGLNGSEKTHITAQGLKNADVIGNDGMTTEDAGTIQRYLLHIITEIPVKK